MGGDGRGDQLLMSPEQCESNFVLSWNSSLWDRSKVLRIASSSRASLAGFQIQRKRKEVRIWTQLIKALAGHTSSTAPLCHEKAPNGHLYLASRMGKGKEAIPRKPLA